MRERTGRSEERPEEDDELAPVIKRRPSNRTRRRSGRRRRSKTRRWAWLSVLLRRPTRTFAGAIISALAISIVVNALFLQKAKHPAPPSVPVGRHRRTATTRVHHAQRRHARVSGFGDARVRREQRKDGIATLLKTKAARHPTGELKPAAAKSRDGIAGLIRRNTPAAADTATPSPETVAAAQEALVRLGFVLRADGVLGSATRKAIELFERDHRMPVDGILSPRVARRLSELSGLAIR